MRMQGIASKDMSDRGLGLIAVSLVKLLRVQRRVAGELVREGKSPPLNLGQQGAPDAADRVGLDVDRA
jgi:hypothetical protein